MPNVKRGGFVKLPIIYRVKRASKFVGIRGIAFMLNRWRKDERSDRR